MHLQGAYGSVCEGTWREEAVAVKQMHVTAEEIASVMQEVQLD